MFRYFLFLGFLISIFIGIKTFVGDSYTIISPSMTPTFEVGEKVWINKLNTRLNRNDIAAFYAPDGTAVPYIKRCKGIPLDSITQLYDGTFSLKNESQNIDNQYFVIPEKDISITINPQNIAFYKPLIEQQEGGQIGFLGTRIYINGEQKNSYTFKQNYYFMLGDNSGNSHDSRHWGLVSEAKILGKIL